MTPGEYTVRVGDSRSEVVRGIQMGSDEGGGFNPGHHTSTYVRFKKALPKKDEGVVIPEPEPEQKPINLTHPVKNPAHRTITQSFGENPEDYEKFGIRGHNGIDFATPMYSIIVAVDDGKVAEAQDDPEGYGLYIKLIHTWGESLYAHLNSIAVEVGEIVRKGDSLGLSGNSGNSSGPHFHFAMRIYPYNRQDGIGGYSDPAPYLGVIAAPPITNGVMTSILTAAQESGMDWRLLASMAWAESSFRPEIDDGLLQISRETWNDWASTVGARDINDPLDNARVGAAYYNWLLSYFGGNEYKALAAYNFGVGNVGAGVPIPAITNEYVNKVQHGRDLLKAVGV